MFSAIVSSETFETNYVYWKKSFHGSLLNGVHDRGDPTLYFQPSSETVFIPGEFM